MTVFTLPETHRRRLRTTNALERLSLRANVGANVSANADLQANIVVLSDGATTVGIPPSLAAQDAVDAEFLRWLRQRDPSRSWRLLERNESRVALEAQARETGPRTACRSTLSIARPSTNGASARRQHRSCVLRFAWLARWLLSAHCGSTRAMAHNV